MLPRLKFTAHEIRRVSRPIAIRLEYVLSFERSGHPSQTETGSAIHLSTVLMCVCAICNM